jgi:hypothetical protein
MNAVRLDNELGGKAVQVRVIQGREPRHFIKMFGGKMVVFSGGKVCSSNLGKCRVLFDLHKFVSNLWLYTTSGSCRVGGAGDCGEIDVRHFIKMLGSKMVFFLGGKVLKQ